MDGWMDGWMPPLWMNLNWVNNTTIVYPWLALAQNYSIFRISEIFKKKSSLSNNNFCQGN
jgi:hypothetical protein